MTDSTWDVVMKRNSVTGGTLKIPPLIASSKNSTDHRLSSYAGVVKFKTITDIDIGSTTNSTIFGDLDGNTARNQLQHHPTNILLKDSSSNETGWMDFLHILVHQHAKTIVHLEELTAEVEKLKDFRSSFLNSITGEISKGSCSGVTGSAGSSSRTPASDLVLIPAKDVWTSSSSPHKQLIDSGFSTETKESSPNQKEDEDPLYSLLDLIQTKLSNSLSNQVQQLSGGRGSRSGCSKCGGPLLPNGTRHSEKQLGRLDLVLGFRAGITENVSIPREVIRAILREVEPVELQRQLLFAVANIKTLEAQLSSLELEGSNSRLASKYLALSHENELLRFKLKEQEIQLEGTKAKLRILEKSGQLTSRSTDIRKDSTSNLPPTTSSNSLKLSSVPLDSLSNQNPLANASNISTQQHPASSSFSDDERMPRRPYPRPIGYLMPTKDLSVSTPMLEDIKGIHSDSHPRQHPYLLSSSSSTTQLSKMKLKSETHTQRLSSNGTQLKLFPGEEIDGVPISRPSPPSSSPGISRIPVRINLPGIMTTSQSINSSSKSPASSISSKSSIPIAVSRLKHSNRSSSSGVKKSTSHFWTGWFAT